MVILNKGFAAAWIAMAALLLYAAPVMAGGAADAKKHSAEMMEQADDMVGHGEAGHLDIMIKHAKSMVMHAKAAVKAIGSGGGHGKTGKKHIEAAIEEAEKAIDHGGQGHGGIAMKHARSAEGHAKEGNMHVMEMK